MARRHSKRGGKQPLVEKTLVARASRHGVEAFANMNATCGKVRTLKVAAGPTMPRGKKNEAPSSKPKTAA